MLSLLLIAAVAAQGNVPDVDIQRYAPSLAASHTLWTDDAGTAEGLYPLARLSFGYMNDPLAFETDEERFDLVTGALDADLQAGLQAGRFQVSARLPMLVRSWGEGVTTASGRGAPALGARFTILDRDAPTLGLALALQVRTPWTTLEAPFADRGTGAIAGLILDKRIHDGLLALNVLYHRSFGAASGDASQVFDPQADVDRARLGLRLGAGYLVTDHLDLSIDFSGEHFLGNALSTPGTTPVETLAGLRVSFGRRFSLRLGGGMGLVPGLGAPLYRGTVQLGIDEPSGPRREPRPVVQTSNRPKVEDTDNDGLIDEGDTCPAEAEDKDGFQDDDGCPDPRAEVKVRIRDIMGETIPGIKVSVEGSEKLSADIAESSFQLHAGTWALYAEADGYSPVSTSFEVKVGQAQEVVRTMDAIAPNMSSLRLVVTDRSGTPLPCSLVMDQGGAIPLAGGRFSALVVPGKHTFRISAPGYKASSVEVVLEAGKERSLGVKLFPEGVAPE